MRNNNTKEVLTKTLNINGNDYTFTANRNAISIVNTFYQNYVKYNKNSSISIEQSLDYSCCALLRTAHPEIKLSEAKEIRKIATSEDYYGDKFNDFLNKWFAKCEVKGKKVDELDFLDEEKEETGEF